MQSPYYNFTLTQPTDNMPTLLLYGEIGGEDGINGDAFAAQLYDMAAAGVPQCRVRINSPGGSVLQGMSIYSAIQNTSMAVDTYIDGMAASIAGVIAMAGRQVHMAGHALLMIHNPSGPDQTPQDVEALDKIRASLISIFSTRRGIDANTLSDMMDKETWLDSKQALACKLVDDIYDAPATAATPSRPDAARMSARQLYEMYNNALTHTMNTVPKEQYDTLQDKYNDLKQKYTDLQKQLNELQDKDNERTETMANEMVEDAIKSGRISADTKDAWLNLARTDLAAARHALNGIAAKGHSRSTLMSGINPARDTHNDIPADRQNWTFTDWSKKNPKGLEKIYHENRELYETLKNNDLRIQKYKS